MTCARERGSEVQFLFVGYHHVGCWGLGQRKGGEEDGGRETYSSRFLGKNSSSSLNGEDSLAPVLPEV